MSDITKRASFNLIRYAAVWEDADLLLKALNLQPGVEILCICSAGDNALSLLSASPARVVAIDLSEPQLHLAALKKAAFQRLEYDDLLRFLTHTSSDGGAGRLSLYKKLRPALPADAVKFWDARVHTLAKGVFNAGKFERYFAVFRKWALPLVHSRRTVEALLREKSDAEQARLYRERWNTWRWRALMSIFFSRFVLGRYGRDPAFLEHVDVPVSAFIRGQVEAHAQSARSARNPFLHRIFTGRYNRALPYFLRPENFDAIRTNIHKLELRKQSADDAMIEKSYDAYALSNIFEYMSAEAFAAFAQRVTPHVPSGARLAFWNLMVPRALHAVMPDVYHYHAAESAAWRKEDMGFFYSRFLLETRV